MIKAKISRPSIDIGQTSAEEHGQDKIDNVTADNKPPESVLHLTTRERLVGDIGRAFNCPVDVDHEAMKARLNSGLLSMVIPKKVRDKNYAKRVSVEHV